MAANPTLNNWELGCMDDWEQHFREKSYRRSRPRQHRKVLKRGILMLLLSSLATAAYLWRAGS
jgi:hypothetical protein